MLCATLMEELVNKGEFSKSLLVVKEIIITIQIIKCQPRIKESWRFSPSLNRSSWRFSKKTMDKRKGNDY